MDDEELEKNQGSPRKGLLKNKTKESKSPKKVRIKLPTKSIDDAQNQVRSKKSSQKNKAVNLLQVAHSRIPIFREPVTDHEQPDENSKLVNILSNVHELNRKPLEIKLRLIHGEVSLPNVDQNNGQQRYSKTQEIQDQFNNQCNPNTSKKSSFSTGNHTQLTINLTAEDSDNIFQRFYSKILAKDSWITIFGMDIGNYLKNTSEDLAENYLKSWFWCSAIHLRFKIAELFQIDHEDQILMVYKGKMVSNYENLYSLGIGNGSTIHIIHSTKARRNLDNQRFNREQSGSLNENSKLKFLAIDQGRFIDKKFLQNVTTEKTYRRENSGLSDVKFSQLIDQVIDNPILIQRFLMNPGVNRLAADLNVRKEHYKAGTLFHKYCTQVKTTNPEIFEQIFPYIQIDVSSSSSGKNETVVSKSINTLDFPKLLTANLQYSKDPSFWTSQNLYRGLNPNKIDNYKYEIEQNEIAIKDLTNSLRNPELPAPKIKKVPKSQRSEKELNSQSVMPPVGQSENQNSLNNIHSMPRRRQNDDRGLENYPYRSQFIQIKEIVGSENENLILLALQNSNGDVNNAIDFYYRNMS